MNDLQFDQEIDCRGLSCPLPVLKTKIAVEKMDTGQVLKMVCSDSGSLKDMPSWCKRTGHSLLHHEESDGVFTYFVKVK